MEYRIVRLVASRIAIREAFDKRLDIESDREDIQQTCNIPADDVMLGILHRLIKSGEEVPDGSD
jgi:hypothetical protein